MRTKKTRPALRGLLICLLAAAGLFAAYSLYRWFDSAGDGDLSALARQAEAYMGGEGLQIVETAQRGDYLAALCTGPEGRLLMCQYDRDRLWHNRWHANGGKPSLRPGELSSWNYGSPQGEAVLIFCGYDLPEEVRGYTFQNGGVTYECPVNGGTVLDVFVILDGGDISGSPVPLGADGLPLER